MHNDLGLKLQSRMRNYFRRRGQGRAIILGDAAKLFRSQHRFALVGSKHHRFALVGFHKLILAEGDFRYTKIFSKSGRRILGTQRSWEMRSSMRSYFGDSGGQSGFALKHAFAFPE